MDFGKGPSLIPQNGPWWYFSMYIACVWYKMSTMMLLFLFSFSFFFPFSGGFVNVLFGIDIAALQAFWILLIRNVSALSVHFSILWFFFLDKIMSVILYVMQREVCWLLPSCQSDHKGVSWSYLLKLLYWPDVMYGILYFPLKCTLFVQN